MLLGGALGLDVTDNGTLRRKKKSSHHGGHHRNSDWLCETHQQQGCRMAKFDPFLSLDGARVEGVGTQSKERKGANFAA